MNFISVEDPSGLPIELSYEDIGTGKPILFLHPWPLSSKCWNQQVPFFTDAGFRVVTFDRRGFGRSSKGSNDYDYDILANDLDTILRELDLYEVTLAGFSMGGGELSRYLGKYGSSRISHAIFIASVPPKFASNGQNLEDLHNDSLATMQAQLLDDRAQFLQQQMQKFFSISTNSTNPECMIYVDQAIDEASLANTNALVRSIDTWRTDLTCDFEMIDIPTLIINGDGDQLTPVAMAKKIQEAVRGSRLCVIEHASHGVVQTHASIINNLILEFIAN